VGWNEELLREMMRGERGLGGLSVGGSGVRNGAKMARV